MASSNQRALMEGILFPSFKVQNQKNRSIRRQLSRQKYLQRRAANPSKSSQKVESFKNEMSEPPTETIFPIIYVQDEISEPEVYQRFKPLKSHLPISEFHPENEDIEFQRFQKVYVFILTSLFILCLYNIWFSL